MLNSLRTFRSYTKIALSLTAVSLLLSILSAAIAFQNGYYAVTPLTVIKNVISVLSLAFLLLFPLWVKDSPRATADAPSPMLPCLAVALCLLLCFISLIRTAALVAAPTLLFVLAFLSLPLSLLFFVLQALPRRNVTPLAFALLGGAFLLTLTSLLCLTYFDTAVAMNSPLKLGLHLSLIAAMLSTLQLLKARAGAPRPRSFLAFSAASLFLCLTKGAEGLLLLLAEGTSAPLFFAAYLLLISLAVYTAVPLAGNSLSSHEK